MSNLTYNIIDIARCTTQYRTEQMAPLGLKACHGSYIYHICAEPGLTQDQLAKRVFFNKSNVTRQLAVLEEGGFVERRPCPEDKRAIRIYPTEKARQELPRIRAILRAWEELMTQDLTVEEVQAVTAALGKMKTRAAQWMED